MSLAIGLPKAICDQLSRDAHLAAMLSKYNGVPSVFYGNPPERAEPPFVIVGGAIENETRNTKTSIGHVITREVVVITDEDGDESAADTIAERVVDVLKFRGFNVPGFRVVESRVVEGPRQEDVEGGYARALRHRAWITEERSSDG